MVHRDDPPTSVDAAVVIEPHRRELQQRVLRAIAERGPLTDAELENLPEFAGYGPSTIRKRRGELCDAGDLIVVDVRRNARGRAMQVWNLSHRARQTRWGVSL